MTKATHDPTTGDRTVAPEIHAAGRARSRNTPGLTPGPNVENIPEAALGNHPPSDTATNDISPETAAVALTAPSILDLGKQLAAVEIAHEAFDSGNMRLSLKVGDAEAARRSKQRGEAAWEVLEPRAEALRELIATMPALTIQDAAVQIALICTASGRLSASIHSRESSTAMADQIERMALGLLPLVARAAGLDLEAMNWASNEYLRVHRFDGVGVTS